MWQEFSHARCWARSRAFATPRARCTPGPHRANAAAQHVQHLIRETYINFLIDEDVLGLDVPVDNALGVQKSHDPA